VRLHIRGLRVILLADPHRIEDVLVTHHGSFTVDRLSRGMRDAIGESLLVSDGEFWLQQRRLIQPVFQRARLPSYADTARPIIESQLNQGISKVPVEASQFMSDLALRIVGVTVLGYDFSNEIQLITDALNVLMRRIHGISNTGVRPPVAIPTPGNLRCRKALMRLRGLIHTVLQSVDDCDHRAEPTLLTVLRNAQRAGPSRISERQVMDELITMLLVGHETVALTLTYAAWLLAAHPDVQARAREEVDRCVGRESPKYSDLTGLKFLEGVMNESLRLYPPVWAFGREAVERVNIAGVHITPATQVLISPWVSHRDPTFFSRPADFRPDRWITGELNDLPRFAFLPFGGGPRTCVGDRLARTEVILVLTLLLQRYRIKPDANSSLQLLPSITLRPRHALNIEFSPR
jgi:cytochrome P450